MGMIRVDLRNGVSQEVNPGEHNTLAEFDGMYWYKDSLIGVQYGAGGHRIGRFRLSPDGLHVKSAEIFENRSSMASFPTTGAILGNNFYFIGNTGIANY